MDAWKLLRRLAAACSSASTSAYHIIVSSTNWPIHTQLLAHSAHILRCPEILQYVLHVLIVICPCAWSSAKSRLIVQAAVRPLDAHVSNAAR